MSNIEARDYVSQGLQRRREERQRRDAALEQQERLLRLTINDNHKVRTMTDTQRIEVVRETRAARARVRRQKERKAVESVHRYAKVCLGIFALSIATPLPAWAAVTLAAGLAVFPTVDVLKMEGIA